MSNLILLFLCLFLGIILRKAKLFPENGHLALNSFVLNISLSALSLYYIPKIKINSEVLFPIAVAWIGVFTAIIFFSVLGKKLGWSKSVIGALIMCAGFGNTSFVGIPVIQALYGEEGLKTLLLVDQPGSFVALSTVGIGVCNYYSGGKSSVEAIILKIIKFPPFIAFFVALGLNLLSISMPETLDEVLYKLGATTVPIALVSVGSQLQWQKWESEKNPLFWGLLFKLLLFPLVIYGVYFLLLQKRGVAMEVCVLEAAMAPMITSALMASAHGLQPKLCNLMIGIGIPLSFITLMGWYFLIK